MAELLQCDACQKTTPRPNTRWFTVETDTVIGGVGNGTRTTWALCSRGCVAQFFAPETPRDDEPPLQRPEPMIMNRL